MIDMAHLSLHDYAVSFFATRLQKVDSIIQLNLVLVLYIIQPSYQCVLPATVRQTISMQDRSLQIVRMLFIFLLIFVVVGTIIYSNL